MILALLACTGGASEVSYTELVLLPPAEALERCPELGDEDERGDCITFNVTELAKEGVDAWESCLQLHGPWRERCLLEYSDTRLLLSEQAAPVCEHAFGLQERCLAHAFSRDVEERWKTMPQRGEQELVDWLAGRMTALDYDFPQGKSADELVALQLANKRLGEGQRWLKSSCGSLSQEGCVKAYEHALKRQKGVGAGACASGAVAARDAGTLPAFDEALEPIVEESLVRWCRAHHPDALPEDKRFP